VSSPRVLILPGWQNSGPYHWQSRWEAAHGYTRVDQHDWMWPLRGDWITRLEDVVTAGEGPVVLAAHSLGCNLTVAWASISRSTHRVLGALLVAPGDVEQPDTPPALRSWSPIPQQPLPFPSVLVASRNDPYCRFERAQHLAQGWGARLVDAGNAGHINGQSGLGDWPEGHAHLKALMNA
jgi:predicted alpha/beta hydrolase family esterase